MNQRFDKSGNVILMLEKVTRIKSGITISVGVSVKTRKNIMCAKTVIFEILLRVIVKMVNM